MAGHPNIQGSKLRRSYLINPFCQHEVFTLALHYDVANNTVGSKLNDEDEIFHISDFKYSDIPIENENDIPRCRFFLYSVAPQPPDIDCHFLDFTLPA